MDAIQVDLWNRKTGEIIGAIISPQPDGRRYQLSVEVPELELSLQGDGPDLFAALQQLRKTMEPLGWFPLCNGARVDCYPSGMARDMGGGNSVYMLSARPSLLRRRLPLVGTFDPAPKESVSSVAEQDAYYERWLARRG